MPPALFAGSPSDQVPTGARWRVAGDIAIAGVLLALGMAEIWAALPSRSGSGSKLWSSVAVVVATAPLVIRRSRPLLTVAIIGVLLGSLFALVPVYVLFYGAFVPVAFATFSVARHGRGHEPFYGAAFIGIGVVGLTVFVPGQDSVGSVIFNVGFIALAWFAGWSLALFERRAAQSRRRAVEAEVAAKTLAVTAVIEERTRIARELHDIVAHAVSVIVVQAGAAEAIVEEDPAYVRAALNTIRTTGAGALGEMRRVVAMLRDADDLEPLAPQPGLEALPELIEHARRGGLDASLHVDGTPSPLPTGLDLAAYRIVQEALSNVRRHAAASQASVRLTYRTEGLDVEIRDNGVGAVVSPATAGHGLIGMRERAALYGGRLEVASADGDGFTVTATLPLATT